MLVYDWELVEDFFNRLFSDGLASDETVFLSLSARNKYLTPEEREFYKLGRTEMFGRTVMKSLDEWEFYMQKLLSNLVYRRTKAGHPFPEKALVVYANVNPCSMVEAGYAFEQQFANMRQQALSALMSGKEPNLEGFVNAERHLLNAVQKSRSVRRFVDLDFDSKDEGLLRQMLKELPENREVLSTQGGFHVLLRPADLKAERVNLKAVTDKYAKLTGCEVTVNANAMVPVAGTLQAGKEVRFWE